MAGKWGKMAAQAQPGGKYVKLAKTGDACRFVWDPNGDVGQEITHWKELPNKERKITTADDPDGKPSTKIAACVWDVDAKEWRMLKLTPPTFGKLGEKLDEFGDTHRVYRIKRGMGTNGFVTYEIDHIGPADPNTIAKMDAAQPFSVLDEKDVYPLPEAESEPEPVKPAAMPRAKAAPKAAEPAAPDGDIPF